MENPNATFWAGAKTYQDFLNSDLWKDIKEWTFELRRIKTKRGKGLLMCERCKINFPFSLRNKKMTIHHLNYNCVGSERAEDLMILCRKCHNFIHSKNNINDLKLVPKKINRMRYI